MRTSINGPGRSARIVASVLMTLKRVYCYLFHWAFRHHNDYGPVRFNAPGTYCSVCNEAWCDAGWDCCYHKFESDEN
jgi:hypothetical protein